MYVNVAVLKETHPHERRVALVPSVVPKLIKLGARLHMQTGAGESARGGSLSAINPISCIAPAGPAATARTRNRWASSSATSAEAVGAFPASAETTAKAPFTTRCVPPPAGVTLASAIFVAGSNGTNFISLEHPPRPFP
jgi:hypothetical protein